MVWFLVEFIYRLNLIYAMYCAENFEKYQELFLRISNTKKKFLQGGISFFIRYEIDLMILIFYKIRN